VLASSLTPGAVNPKTDAAAAVAVKRSMKAVTDYVLPLEVSRLLTRR